MTKFDTAVQTILEGLKDPKDNPCWKCYHPVGIKKKAGRVVPNCVPVNKEVFTTSANTYKLSKDFNELPSSPPHGFWVTKNGQFVTIPAMWGHDEAIKQLFPNIAQGQMGTALQMSAMKNGMIRMAKSGNTYELTYHPLYANKAAVKTARDIAAFYNMGVEDDFENV